MTAPALATYAALVDREQLLLLQAEREAQEGRWDRYGQLLDELEPVQVERLKLEQRDRRARGMRGGGPSDER